MYRAEFSETEPDLSFTAQKIEIPAKVMKQADQYRIIRAVFVCPNGVQRMSQSMKGLVETSNNLAIVKCINGKFETYSLHGVLLIHQRKQQPGKLLLFFT